MRCVLTWISNKKFMIKCRYLIRNLVDTERHVQVKASKQLRIKYMYICKHLLTFSFLTNFQTLVSFMHQSLRFGCMKFDYK